MSPYGVNCTFLSQTYNCDKLNKDIIYRIFTQPTLLKVKYAKQ